MTRDECIRYELSRTEGIARGVIFRWRETRIGLSCKRKDSVIAEFTDACLRRRWLLTLLIDEIKKHHQHRLWRTGRE
jgi:hypothetical protein